MATRTKPGTFGCPTCGAPAGHRCLTRDGNPTNFHQPRRDLVNRRDEPTRWRDFTAALTNLHEAKDESPSAWYAVGFICAALIAVGLIGLLVDGARAWAWVTVAGCLSGSTRQPGSSRP